MTDNSTDQDIEIFNPLEKIELSNDEMVIRDLLNVDLHHKSFVSGQVDNLTLTFNIKIDDFDLFKSKLLMKKNESYFIKTDNAFSVNYSHCFFECNISQNTDVKNNARLDFNPTLVDKETSEFIINTILKDVTNLKMTRLDIALDYSMDLSEYHLEPSSGLKKRLYMNSANILETMYLGSKQRLYRVYNKKKERLEVANQDMSNYENYWRVEVQIRNQYLQKIPDIFEGFYLRNVNFKDLDLANVSNKMYKDIYFYLHATSSSNYFSDRQLVEVKKAIKACNKNEDIDINNDYKLIFQRLMGSIEKYGIII